jgi:hypothetical protein
LKSTPSPPRKFDRLGRSQELLRLNVSSTLHKYHLALDTEERFLYMSDPANYRIIRIPLSNIKAAKRLLLF